jgi:hypothetical protein
MAAIEWVRKVLLRGMRVRGVEPIVPHSGLACAIPARVETVEPIPVRDRMLSLLDARLTNEAKDACARMVKDVFANDGNLVRTPQNAYPGSVSGRPPAPLGHVILLGHIDLKLKAVSDSGRRLPPIFVG